MTVKAVPVKKGRVLLYLIGNVKKDEKGSKRHKVTGK